MPYVNGEKTDNISARDHGLIGSLDLKIAQRTEPPWGIATCAQAVALDVSFGDKVCAAAVWNQRLHELNTLFGVLRSRKPEEQNSFLEMLLRAIGEQSLDKIATITLTEIKRRLATLKLPTSTHIPALLDLAPMVSADTVDHTLGSLDPLAELTAINLRPALDDGIFSFLMSHGATALLQNRNKIPEKLNSAVESLASLAKSQAPMWGTAWMSQTQQKLYDTRNEVIAERILQLKYLPQLIELYILSAMSYTNLSSDAKIYAQCKQLAINAAKQVDFAVSKKALEHKDDYIVAQVTEAVAEQLPQNSNRHLQIICLFNNFSHPQRSVSFMDFLDAFWGMKIHGREDNALYCKGKSALIKAHENVTQVITSPKEFTDCLALIKIYFDAKVRDEFLSSDNQLAAQKKVSQTCIQQVSHEQLHATSYSNWFAKTPLDFYVAGALPKVAIPKYDDDYSDYSIATASHVVLVGYYARHNPSVLLMSLIAAMMNNELAYNMSGCIDQVGKVAKTRQIINAYLQELNSFTLTKKERDAVKLIRELLDGTLNVDALGEPITNNGFVIGYKKIEVVLEAVLSETQLQILSDQFGEVITPRKILKLTFQKVLRDEVKATYDTFKLNKNVKNLAQLSTQMKLAMAYLYSNDPLITQFEQDTKACVTTLHQVVASGRLQDHDSVQLKQNYILLALHPERLNEFNTVLDNYLKKFNGDDISLYPLFIIVGMSAGERQWPERCASYRYFSQLIAFYFKGAQPGLPAIKAENEKDYSLALSLIFTEHSACSVALRTEFQTQLLQFYETNKNWLQPLLRASESFLANPALKIKIRSELFLKLFNDTNNVRELGQYIQVIKEYHGVADFSKVILPATHKEFEQKLAKQCGLVKDSDFDCLVKIIDNEKWIKLLQGLFARLATQYAIDVLTALTRIANTDISMNVFRLLVGNFVKQLPRTKDNADKVQLAENVDALLDTSNAWDGNVALLVKHFGSSQFEEIYYLHALTELMENREKDACYLWLQQFKDLYSAQTIERLEVKFHDRVVSIFEEHVLPVFKYETVTIADYALADVLNNSQIKQMVNQQRLLDIMKPCDASSQISEFFKLPNHFDEETFYVKYDAVNPDLAKQPLIEMFGSMEFFVDSAAKYIKNAKAFNPKCLAIKLLRDLDLQKLLPENLQLILNADDAAFKHKLKVQGAIKLFQIKKTFDSITDFKSIVPNSSESLLQRHVVHAHQKCLHDLLLMGISMLLQESLMQSKPFALPADLMDSYMRQSLMPKFLAKCEKDMLSSHTGKMWLQAQAYTKLREGNKKINLSDQKACNKAIRKTIQLLGWGASEEPLTDSECRQYLFKLTFQKTQSCDGATDFEPSLRAIKVIYAMTGTSKQEVYHQYINKHLQSTFAKYYQAQLKNYDTYYKVQTVGRLVDTHQVQLAKFVISKVEYFFDELTKFLAGLDKNNPDIATSFELLSQLQSLKLAFDAGQSADDCNALTTLLKNIPSYLNPSVVPFAEFVPMGVTIDAQFPGLLKTLVSQQQQQGYTPFHRNTKKPAILHMNSNTPVQKALVFDS